jgi:hypothetical protein
MTPKKIEELIGGIKYRPPTGKPGRQYVGTSDRPN